ncbi:hypothetical protein RDWZM_000468 [Blomia tropicalis]|uniref:F-box domain-containing protein n=1 Tax=Blomia tropicalis TaxID=40697 RepID=A0A9Q0MAZ1_BLOTA|nr:hypothetical protein BLOT_013828 [Blomia tropicalis]KAJ6221923.1 hypothetical protein RDWZM_000468 [Blomia tropicalis]
MDFNVIPEPFLLEMFKYFSIDELFVLRSICHRINRLVMSSLKRIQTLRIFGRNNLYLYRNVKYLQCDRLDLFGASNEFDFIFCLNSDHFTNCDNPRLLKLFPNIKCLTIVNYHVNENNLGNLELLLSNWCSSLITLKLVGLNHGSYQWNRIANQLDRMINLRTLSIDVNLMMIKSLKIFPSLNEFCCRFEFSNIVKNGKKNNNALIGSNIKNYGLYVENYHSLNMLTQSEIIKLTRLSIRIGFLRQLKIIGAKFSSIRYLDLTFYDNESNVECFLLSLQKLPRLVELKLFLSPLHNYFMKINEKNIENLPKLNRIQMVELQFPIDPHRFHWIEAIFPCAKQLSLYINNCLFHDFAQLLCENQCDNCRLINSLIARCEDNIDSSFQIIIKDGCAYE